MKKVLVDNKYCACRWLMIYENNKGNMRFGFITPHAWYNICTKYKIISWVFSYKSYTDSWQLCIMGFNIAKKHK